MIGFPKTSTDFLKYREAFPLQKEWKDHFEKQADFYLKNQKFFSQKTEGWKYFPFQRLINKDFVFNQAEASLIKKDTVPCLPSSLFLSVKNGQIFPLFHPRKDLLIYSWKDILQGKTKLDPPLKEKILLTLKKQRNPFCSLSDAFYENGLVLIIKKSLKQTLEIHYTQSDTNELQGIHLRNFIFLQDEASARVLEVFHERPEKKPLFFNAQTDCFIGRKSSLEHIRMDQAGDQDIFINQLFAELSKTAKACFFSLSLNAGISRWHSELQHEEKSSSEIRGLSLLDGKKHTNHKAVAKHKEARGSSRQFYKSFLFDSAKQIFQGFTSIEKPAQKSDTSQLSKNFLFGTRAFAMAFPELDISADNVKASHGATVAPFEENKELTFYLQSRGIDKAQAFHLVLSGLIKETLSCLQANSREVVQRAVQKKLRDITSSITKSQDAVLKKS